MLSEHWLEAGKNSTNQNSDSRRAEMITELIRFEPEICICKGTHWNLRETLHV